MRIVKPVAVIHHLNFTPRSGLIGLIGASLDGRAPRDDIAAVSSRYEMWKGQVDLFLRIWEATNGDGLILYISDPVVRKLIAQSADQYPGLELREVLTGSRLRDTWSACRRALSEKCTALASKTTGGQQTDPEQAQQKVLPKVTVATDASKQYRQNTIGLGFASSNGRVHMGTMDSGSIQNGELAAVTMALHYFSGKAEEIEVLTDSQFVARLLNGSVEAGRHQEQDAACRQAMKKCAEAGSTVTVRWVRGHNGHVLNEIADQAAVQSRRCAQWSMPEQRRNICDRLRGELREALEVCDADYVVRLEVDRDSAVLAA